VIDEFKVQRFRVSAQPLIAEASSLIEKRDFVLTKFIKNRISNYDAFVKSQNPQKSIS